MPDYLFFEVYNSSFKVVFTGFASIPFVIINGIVLLPWLFLGTILYGTKTMSIGLVQRMWFWGWTGSTEHATKDVFDVRLMNEIVSVQILFTSVAHLVIQIMNNTSTQQWSTLDYVCIITSGLNTLDGLYRMGYHKIYLGGNLLEMPVTVNIFGIVIYDFHQHQSSATLHFFKVVAQEGAIVRESIGTNSKAIKTIPHETIVGVSDVKTVVNDDTSTTFVKLADGSGWTSLQGISADRSGLVTFLEPTAKPPDDADGTVTISNLDFGVSPLLGVDAYRQDTDKKTADLDRRMNVLETKDLDRRMSELETKDLDRRMSELESLIGRLLHSNPDSTHPISDI